MKNLASNQTKAELPNRNHFKKSSAYAKQWSTITNKILNIKNHNHILT